MNKSLYSYFANTYALYLKTQCYHWNVRGANFFELHKLFESHYENLAETVDEIAERVRALGDLILASFESLKASKTIKDANEKFSSKEMIEDLISSHKEICQQIKSLMVGFEEKKDFATIDLLTRNSSEHEKQIWFLESFIL